MVLIYSGRIMRPLSYTLKCNKLSQNLAAKNNQHQLFTVSVEAGGKKQIQAELKSLHQFLPLCSRACSNDRLHQGRMSLELTYVLSGHLLSRPNEP